MNNQQRDWEKRFNQEFRHVGWIPQNKAHIIAFISTLLTETEKRVRDDAMAEAGSMSGYEAGRDAQKQEIIEMLEDAQYKLATEAMDLCENSQKFQHKVNVTIRDVLNQIKGDSNV